MSFSDTVVMVTGGGTGIGQAIAEAFVRGGASVYITGRSKERQEKALKHLCGMGKAYGISMDVSDPVNVAGAFKELDEKAGRLDILVNNAGIREVKSVFDLTPEEWKAVIDTNLNGTFYCSREAALRMRKNPNGGSGAIVNITSVSGLIGVTCRPAYNASKHGIIGLTRNLAKDLAPYHIRVNAVAPGVVRTELTEAYYHDQNFLSGMAQTVPLGAAGKSSDIAQAVCFLASEHAAFITGAVLPVDGGWLCEKSFVVGNATAFTSAAASSALE